MNQLVAPRLRHAIDATPARWRLHHAVDATPARWRGVVVSHRSFQPTRPRFRQHPTHGSMCAQADYCLANVDVDDEGAVMISGNDPEQMEACAAKIVELTSCLLYTSPSPRDRG